MTGEALCAFAKLGRAKTILEISERQVDMPARALETDEGRSPRRCPPASSGLRLSGPTQRTSPHALAPAATAASVPPPRRGSAVQLVTTRTGQVDGLISATRICASRQRSARYCRSPRPSRTSCGAARIRLADMTRQDFLELFHRGAAAWARRPLYRSAMRCACRRTALNRYRKRRRRRVAAAPGRSP